MRTALTLILTMISVACTDGKENARAICALVDTSGTYSDERLRAVDLLQRTLISELRAGDTVILGTIDADSYDPDNIATLATIGDRPSVAVRQKAAIARALTKLAETVKPAKYTDISGGLLLCRDFLSEVKSARPSVLVLSDLVEELKPGHVRELEPDSLAGLTVTAINVKRMRADRRDPKFYAQRIEAWRTRLAQGGAERFEVAATREALARELTLLPGRAGR
ncbi:MAG: hypothetical protein AAF658_00365 [Myxococcota bacterium]